ncbi:MAG: HK97-gp10 family putative phage morphogenesis protein [Alteromonas macleodii]
MAKKPAFEITGIEETQKILEDLAPRYANNLNKAVNLNMAASAGKNARKFAPSGTGTLKKAIKWRRKRSPPEAPQSIVYVNHGKDAKDDGFYWRFMEYGTAARVNKKGANRGSVRGRYFFRRALAKLNSEWESVYTANFGKKLQQLLVREAKKINK